MTSAASTEPSRVLVFVAHPDDVDFGAAGTVATWTDAAIEVVYCIVTDGDAGGFDRDADRNAVAALRREEQRAAAGLVGVGDVRFLGYPDGAVLASLELRRDLAAQIREIRPDRLVCPSPERNYSRLQASHPDHLAVGEAALCAAYPDARNPFAFPELLRDGLEPHAVNDLWLMAGPNPNKFVDISASIERKVAALLCHRSQLPEPERIEPLIRDFGERTARDQGLEPGRYAEGFFVISL